MKVICISNTFKSIITLGKVYEVLFINDIGGFHIINDKGNYSSIPRSEFMTIEEWRNKQINKILE